MVAYSSLHALRVLDPVLPWKHSHVIKLCQQRVIVDHPMATCPQSVKNWWAEHSQTLCRLGEVFLAFASGVLTVVSFGSPFWIENGTSVDHQGLWQECQITPDASCKPLSDVSGSLVLYMCYKHSSLSNQKPCCWLTGAVMATRAMMCLALLFGLVAWVVSVGALLVHKPKILLPAATAYGLQGNQHF